MRWWSPGGPPGPGRGAEEEEGGGGLLSTPSTASRPATAPGLGSAGVAFPPDPPLTLTLDGLDVAVPGTGRLLLGGARLSLAPGQRAFILGPSGAGKSRLLRAIAALDPCPPGRGGGLAGAAASPPPALTLGGRSPEGWGPPAWRARVLYLPPAPGAAAGSAAGGGAASSRGNGGGGGGNRVGGPGGPTPAGLLDVARAHAAQRSRPGGEPGADPAARARLTSAAESLLLDPPLLDAPWATLSSGQAARAALAVALALAPPVLALDEPTASLDGSAAAAAEAALAACGSALVWVTHDPAQPGRVGGRVYRVVAGAGPGGCGGLVDEGEA